MTKERPVETKQDKSLRKETLKMNRPEKKRRGKHKTKQNYQKKNKTPVGLLITESKPNVYLTWHREKKKQPPSKSANQARRETG